MSEEKETTSESKERILKLIAEDDRWKDHDEITGIDYAEEYKRQTGKDLVTGKYVNQ